MTARGNLFSPLITPLFCPKSTTTRTTKCHKQNHPPHDIPPQFPSHRADGRNKFGRHAERTGERYAAPHMSGPLDVELGQMIEDFGGNRSGAHLSKSTLRWKRIWKMAAPRLVVNRSCQVRHLAGISDSVGRRLVDRGLGYFEINFSF